LTVHFSSYSKSCGRQLAFIKTHIVLFLCIGDDFSSAYSLLEAIFALDEETNPLRRAENSGGNAVQG